MEDARLADQAFDGDLFMVDAGDHNIAIFR